MGKVCFGAERRHELLSESRRRAPSRQPFVHLLTPPCSLDPLVAVVPSPPHSSFGFSSNGYSSFGATLNVDPATGLYTGDPLLGDPPGSGGVKEDVWFGAQSVSPSSPLTIGSQTDSQAGGDFNPPATDHLESPLTQQTRRAIPNLNISLPPNAMQLGAGMSPVSLVGSSANFSTDSIGMNVDPSEDYFHFNDAAFSSAPSETSDFQAPVSVPHSTNPTPPPSNAGSVGHTSHMSAASSAYRLPASQPSSPVRNVFMPGQHPFGLSATGRQRSTTVSGISPFDGSFQMPNFGAQMGTPNNGGVVSAPVSAVPPHLAFTSMHSNAGTPLLQSPTITASPATERVPNPQSGAQTGTGGCDVTMDDATYPQSRRPSAGAPNNSAHTAQGGNGAQAVAAGASGATAGGAAQSSSTNDLAERLTLERLTMLDNIVSEAQSAKAALLSGQQDRLPEALGKINHQLEIAGDLGIVPTPRETTPNSGSNNSVISPSNFSPKANTNVNTTPAAPQPISTAVPALPTSALLPSLPVGQQAGLASSAVSVNGSPIVRAATSAEYPVQPAPPPLVHSHSFPNNHQLPGQVQQSIAPNPTTPVNTTFAQAASLGVHIPVVSSPLAGPSRTTSPGMQQQQQQQQQWLSDNVAAASAAMAAAAAGNPMAMDNHMLQAQVQQMQAAMMQQQGQQQQMEHQQQQQQQQHPQPTSRRPSIIEQRADGRPVARARSASTAKQQQLSMNSTTSTSASISMPPSAWQSRQGSPVDDDDDDDDGSDDETAQRRPKRRRSSAGPDVAEVGPMSGVHISDDVRSQLDQIFHEFLNRVCSDLETCDSKGEKLHQVLMPKKMQRLDESPDYRPFKFRIQAFTNAFHEELQSRGITEETMSIKKVKVYLWHQDLISRFNADGKKAKSKGNHIWHVDAKKLPGGGWVFRPFKRKIIVTPPSFAVINQRYEWEPKIWDPMAPSSSIKPKFSSPPGSLPHWLRWEDNDTKLVGVPDSPQPPIHVSVKADFIDGGGDPATATTEFTIQVVNMPMPMTTEDAVFSANPMMAQQWVTDHPLITAPMPTVQASIPYTMPVFQQPGFGA